MMTELDDVQRSATRHQTPCGDGHTVWHIWGDGPPLVLLHGGSGSWRHWLRNVVPLAREYRVIAADIPGLGESAMPPGEASPQGAAIPLRDGLAELLGPDRHYHLAGFSFGANVSGQLAALEGRHIRTLTLVGAASLGLARPPLELLKVREKHGAERVEAHRENLARLMFHDRTLIDATALAVQEWHTNHARLRSRGFASGTSLKDALDHVTAPLNGIWGEFDAVAWPNVESRLAVIRARDPSMLQAVIPNAGHWVAYEAADAFNAALLGILAQREGRTAPQAMPAKG
jgi:pimeloyl-ACP methyl ester carboxylesterase